MLLRNRVAIYSTLRMTGLPTHPTIDRYRVRVDAVGGADVDAGPARFCYCFHTYSALCNFDRRPRGGTLQRPLFLPSVSELRGGCESAYPQVISRRFTSVLVLRFRVSAFDGDFCDRFDSRQLHRVFAGQRPKSSGRAIGAIVKLCCRCPSSDNAPSHIKRPRPRRQPTVSRQVHLRGAASLLRGRFGCCCLRCRRGCR